MISNELLTELLGFEVSHSQPKGEKEISIFKEGRTDASRYENISELLCKCKEWAVKQKINGVEIIFAVTHFPYTNKVRTTFSYRDTFHPVKFHEENEDTEYKSVFKACEWILKNKEQK